MMKKLVLGSLLLLLLVLGTGCFRSAIGYTSTGGVYQVHNPRALYLDQEARIQAHWEAELEHRGAGTAVYYVTPTKPAPLPPRSRAETSDQEIDLRAFDPIAARTELSRIDVSNCTATIGKRVYGHVQVVFNPDGVVTKVIIDTPSGLNADQVKCVGDRFGTAKVSSFKGSNITMGATFMM